MQDGGKRERRGKQVPIFIMSSTIVENIMSYLN